MLSIDFDRLKAPTAIFSFLRNPHSFEEAVRYAMSLGGDTDTIGAMTGAISGAYHGQGPFPSVEKQTGSSRLHRNVGREPVED